jgi:hypothetical protein
MKSWYRAYVALLTRIAQSHMPAMSILWLLLLGSCGWTCYWLLAEQRLGGELLLPILVTIWLLSWLFIRLAFVFQQPVTAGQSWKAKLSRWWFWLKFHGTAMLILCLLCSCLAISLKLFMVVWRSFG